MVMRTRQQKSNYSRAVLQFAIINRRNLFICPLLICVAAVSITAIVLQSQSLLCRESMSFAFGNSWLQIVKAISVTIATYFLIEFYFVVRKDIALILFLSCADISEYKPLLKFLSIKLGILFVVSDLTVVIFLTFYQSRSFRSLNLAYIQ